MKKVVNCLLLVVSLSLVPAVISCQPTTPRQTEDIKPAFELQADMLGALHTLLLDSEGKLLSRAKLASDDGAVILSIDKGTKLLDGDGKPLSSILVKTEQEMLPLTEDAYIVGVVYDLTPRGATFDPLLKLTISYDPEELPRGVRERDIYIVCYEDTKWDMVRYKQVDTENHRVATRIEHFAKYAVLAPREQSTPIPTPKPDLTSISLEQALSSGKPTLAEFGWRTCVPCKEMKPILEELAVEYQGRLNMVIVEVYEHQDLTNKYRIMAIPTQIVFDSSGEEITRHIGFWPKEEIIAQLEKMGIE